MCLLLEDAGLLADFRQGDSAALERVYRAYAPEVTEYLARSFPAPPSALDLEAAHQETFLRAFSPRARLAYDGRRPYAGYLCAMARSAAVDLLRSAGKLARLTLPQGLHLEPERPAEEADAESLLLREESRARVRRFLARLEPRERRLLELRYLEGLSQECTGAGLGLSRQEVRTREASLRGALRRFLAAARFFPAP